MRTDDGGLKKTEVKDGTKIKKNDLVIVRGTGSSEFMPYGTEVKVHRMHANTLIDNGSATYVKDVDHEEKEKHKLRARRGEQ